MGNTPSCTPISLDYQDQPEERTQSFGSPARSTKSGSTEASHPISDFLRVHIEDRPEKCILDHTAVVNALVEQSMELLRRDNDDASIFSKSSGVLTEEETFDENSLFEPSEISRRRPSFSKSTALSEATVGGRSSVYTASENAFSYATAATTDTKETQQVGNRYDEKSPSRSSTNGDRRKRRSPRVLGKDFEDSNQLQRELQQAITKVSKKESEAKRLGRLVKAIEGGQGCTMIPAALIQDTLPAHLSGTRAREHMTILHLRIKPRFTEFYQSHLSRLLPDSPVTRAVSQGIALNRLSPPRKSFSHEPHYRPSPTRTYSDSSSVSNSVDIVDFGEGPPSHPIRLLATGSSFADLGFTGSLGMVSDRRSSGNNTTGDPSRIKAPSHYLVLLNRRSGVPLAVCALKSATTGPPVVRIYATKRRLFGQRPAATTRKLGLDWSDSSYPLYSWAEIVTEGRYPNRVRYSIYLAKGNDGRFEEAPSYRAEHASVGSPEIRIVGKTEREHTYTGCAILSLCREDGVIEEDLFLNLSVSKGVDPALMLCFAAIVDEAMEKTMRQQFASLSEGIYRRA
eukprot:scaffold1690_cov182-Amphora_coffeaeformis.AAC.61